jgi:hypothetical protein
MIETLNGATADVDAARFQWHIGTNLCLTFLDVANTPRRSRCFPGNHVCVDVILN